MKSAGRDLGCTPRGAIAGRGGLVKVIFLRANRTLLGVDCICDIASEIVGIGQMVIRCGGTLSTIANMSMATPTYAYAYKYAAFDGLRRQPERNRSVSQPNSSARTYNHLHTHRSYTPGNRRFTGYWPWRYTWETNPDTTRRAQRFSALTACGLVAGPG